MCRGSLRTTLRGALDPVDLAESALILDSGLYAGMAFDWAFSSVALKV